MKAKTDRWSWLFSGFQRILFKNSLAASAFLHSWGVVNFWMILKQWGCLPIGKIKEWKKVGFSCSVSLNPKCANEQFGRCHIATLLSTLVTLALIVVVIAKQIPFVPNVNFWLKDSSRLKSFEICRNGKCLFLSLQDLFTWSVSTRIFGFYGIPHLNLSVCVNDNFDRHTNRFENNITQEC